MNITSYDDKVFGSVPALRFFVTNEQGGNEALCVTVSHGCSIIVYEASNPSKVISKSQPSLREMAERIDAVTRHLDDKVRAVARSHLGGIVFLGHLWEATANYKTFWEEVEEDSKELQQFVQYYSAIDEELYLGRFNYQELSKVVSGDKREKKDSLFTANIAIEDNKVGGSVIVDSDCVLLKINRKVEPLSFRFNMSVDRSYNSELVKLAKYFLYALESFSGVILPRSSSATTSIRHQYIKKSAVSTQYVQLSSLSVNNIHDLMLALDSYSNRIRVFGPRTVVSDTLKPTSIFK